MKSISNKFLPLLILFLTINSYSQKDENLVGKVIILKSYCKVLKCESIMLNNDINKVVEYLEPNVKFIVNDINKDSVWLTAINYNKLSKRKYENLEKLNDGSFDKSEYYNNKLYVISKNDFDKSYDLPEEIERISIGLLTLPFKARPQDDFSFDTEFNLSTTLNIRITDVLGTSFNAQFGAGIGSVNLNSSNATGIESGKEQDVATLSFFTGGMLQYKKVQAGIYIGVDQINNQNQYGWKHNGNLWFGFGIGFNVFQISLGEDKKQKQK